MTIKTGTLTQVISFVAAWASDTTSRMLGLSAFTVSYSLNGGGVVVMTTPTIIERSAINMKGVYSLLIDEAGMTSSPGELTINITAANMAPITLTFEVSDIITDLAIIKALSGLNSKMTATSYDSNNNLTAATIKGYPTAGDLVADINELFTITLTASYSGPGKADDHEMKET